MDWREQPDVVRLRSDYASAEQVAREVDGAIIITLSEIRAREAERENTEIAIATGKAAPAALIDCKVNVAALRARLETLEGRAEAAYKELAATRDRLAEVEAKAKAAAWTAGMTDYVKATDRLGAALAEAIEAEEAVAKCHRELGEQFGHVMNWIIGPSERVGNAAYGRRLLRSDAFADWRHWRAEAGVIPESAKKKHLAQKIAADLKRLAARQTREEQQRASAEQAFKKQQWVETRDLSPNKLVKVRMRGAPTEPPPDAA